MFHYNRRYVSSSTMLIFRRSNCIITATGIVTLCKRLYSTPVESRPKRRYAVHTCNSCPNPAQTPTHLARTEYLHYFVILRRTVTKNMYLAILNLP
jgi:hypothetical protein